MNSPKRNETCPLQLDSKSSLRRHISITKNKDNGKFENISNLKEQNSKYEEDIDEIDLIDEECVFVREPLNLD